MRTTNNSTALFVLIIFIGNAAAPMYAADQVGALMTAAVAVDGGASIRPAMARQAITFAIAQGSPRVHRQRCESQKKGVIIGAAVGGVAGAAFALHVNHGVGGVLGTANGANRFLAYSTTAGAGGGALVGYALCR